MELAALGLQYLVLLPLILKYLGCARGARNGKFTLPRAGAFAIAICMSLLALPLASHGSRDLLNPDENGYSFQARIFLQGKLMAEPLPGTASGGKNMPPEISYENHVLISRGWFTHFPPGWPLLLAAGYLLGAPWVLNPLLGLLLLVLSGAIGRSFFSQQTGVLAAIFVCLCPFFLANSVRMMSHTLCACLIAAACWLKDFGGAVRVFGSGLPSTCRVFGLGLRFSLSLRGFLCDWNSGGSRPGIAG